MITPKYPEQAYRRADYQGGTPLILGDGQVWYLPQPTVTTQAWRFVVKGDQVDTDLRPVMPNESSDYLDLVERLYQAEYRKDELAALGGLAVNLLRRNYDLPDAAFSDLLTCSDDDAGTDAWNLIGEIVLGKAPKVTPVG